MSCCESALQSRPNSTLNCWDCQKIITLLIAFLRYLPPPLSLCHLKRGPRHPPPQQPFPASFPPLISFRVCVISCYSPLVPVPSNQLIYFPTYFNKVTTMSNVGIPIKLLYEAEGMKVTVEMQTAAPVISSSSQIFRYTLSLFSTPSDHFHCFCRNIRWKMVKFTGGSSSTRKTPWTWLFRKWLVRRATDKFSNYLRSIWGEAGWGLLRYLTCCAMLRLLRKLQVWRLRWKPKERRAVVWNERENDSIQFRKPCFGVTLGRIRF